MNAYTPVCNGGKLNWTREDHRMAWEKVSEKERRKEGNRTCIIWKKANVRQVYGFEGLSICRQCLYHALPPFSAKVFEHDLMRLKTL